MRSVEEILQSTSDSLFPADLGNRRVAFDSRDVDGDTPLHVLLWRKDVEGAKLLIAAGADPSAVGDMGNTPLHVAVTQELPDIIEALLSAGANPDVRSEFGDTARERAVIRGGAAAEVFNRAAPNNSFKPNPHRGGA